MCLRTGAVAVAGGGSQILGLVRAEQSELLRPLGGMMGNPPPVGDSLPGTNNPPGESPGGLKRPPLGGGLGTLTFLMISNRRITLQTKNQNGRHV